MKDDDDLVLELGITRDRENESEGYLCGGDDNPFSETDKINVKLSTSEQIFGTVCGFGCDEINGDYVDVYKPAIIGPVNTSNGPRNAFLAWIGDSVRIYYSSIVAHSPTIPDNLLTAYISFSTGIEVASANKIQTQ